MPKLDELFQAVKDFVEVQEKAKVLKQRIKALKEELSPEQRAAFAALAQQSNPTWETTMVPEKPRGKQDADMEEVRTALRTNKSPLTSKELRAATGFDPNRMNNTLWLMRDELEKLPANPRRTISSQNMAYKLKMIPRNRGGAKNGDLK